MILDSNKLNSHDVHALFTASMDLATAANELLVARLRGGPEPHFIPLDHHVFETKLDIMAERVQFLVNQLKPKESS